MDRVINSNIFKKIAGIRYWFTVVRKQIFVCTRPEDLLEVSPKIPISIQNVTPDNVHRVMDFRGKRQERAFRLFLDQGQMGVFAVSDAKVVGHIWAIICYKKRQMANGYFKIHKGEAFLHYANVKKSCRRNALFSAMLVALCKRLFNEAGIIKIFADPNVDNIASVRGIQKVGFKPVGRYFYFRFRNKLIYKRNINK